MPGRPHPWSRAGQAGRLGALALSIAAATVAAAPRPAQAAGQEPAAVPARAGAISSSLLESRHGIRINQVAVTGGGGLVDLRFTVLDPARARPLLFDHARPPRLLAEGSTTELQAPTHGAMRNVRLQKDAACFLLYPNARNAIQPGTRVAVTFGDVLVEPVVAR